MTVTNAGRIDGAVYGVRGYYEIPDLTNQSGGVISGTIGAGISLEDSAGTITNQTGGLIESAQGDGVSVGGYGTSYKTATFANAGLVRGGAAGVSVANGRLQQLTNSGTIEYSGAGVGPALKVANGAILDRVTNTGKIGDIVNEATLGDGTVLALSSTGAGATIGILTNSGTINGGMTVANQDLFIHGTQGNFYATNAGSFDGGTITVSNGSLTFASGNSLLGADVVVADVAGTAGAGTMTNAGTLLLVGAQSLDGSFTQTASGAFLSAIQGTSSYGRLAATGLASFDGTLDLVDSGSILAAGQTYELFTFGSSIGDFASLSVLGTTLAPLGSGQWGYGSLILSEIWTSTSMSLSISAVPEIDPASAGSVLALLLGALGLLDSHVRRRRIA